MNETVFLSRVFLFESLAEGELFRIADFSEKRGIKPGQTLFSEGEPALAFYIVTFGQVKITKFSAKGEEQILHVHGPGEVIAEAAIFGNEIYPAHCIALEQTEVIRIPRSDFIRLLMNSPEIALKLMAGYSRRLRQFVAQIENLTLRTVQERLASYLLGNSVTKGKVRICTLQISKKELASVLGTIPETLSRMLRTLKKSGVIAESRKVITILKPEKLVISDL